MVTFLLLYRCVLLAYSFTYVYDFNASDRTLYEPRGEKTMLRDFQPGLTQITAQSQKQARSLKFRIKGEEGLYCPCSENKGADQLRSYCEADLRLCFRIGKNPVFS